MKWKWVTVQDAAYLVREDFDPETHSVYDDAMVIADDGSSDGEYERTIEPDSPHARLIAAAPELLEALNDCDHAFAAWQMGVVPGRPEDILALIAKVRAAIAKAEGLR